MHEGQSIQLMKRRAAFTLIELLTVIAIIALLAAIIFPVFSRARESAYRNGDIANMNALRSALQLYRVDQGGYPPQLLGYVTLYQTGPNAGEVIPATSLIGFLYPNRVDSTDTFRPSLNRVSATAITTAVYPNADPRAVGSAPILDLNGDGAITGDDDIAGARQAFGPNDGFVAIGGGVVNDPANAARFYSLSGYDAAEVRVGNGTRTELRYTLFWTSFGLTTGSAFDDPRQLGYADPPENTVVTWNSFFRSYDGNGNLERTRNDIVLFLGGNARPFDSADLAERSWRVLP